LRRHSWALQGALSAVVLVTTGIGVTVLAGDEQLRADLFHGKILDALQRGGWTWSIVLAGTAIVAFQTWVTAHLEPKQDRGYAAEVIEPMLKAAVRALVFPKDWEHVPVRAFCHRYDERKQVLRPVCSAGYHLHQDERSAIPCTEDKKGTWIIARSFLDRKTVIEELGRPLSDEENQLLVWHQIKTIHATPIFTPGEDPRCLGTLSVDTSLPLARLPLDSDNAKDVVRLTAAAIGLLWRDV
jgi:hypothetical protein